MKARSILFALAAMLATAIPVSAKLKEGDPAPPLKIAKWVKGTLVRGFRQGRVYVVEFWATWCSPCIESIPHVTELARKHKGGVTFAGIDIWEQEKGARRVVKVTKFVRDMGPKMGYTVGMDTDSGATSNTWLPRNGQNGIPTAFVIGRNGRIAWIGHPMQLDKVLPPIVKGTFNVQAAARTRIATDALNARLAKAYQANDHRLAVAEIDKYLPAHPDMESIIGMNKYISLLQYNVPSAMSYGDHLAGVCKDDAMTLNAMAYMALDDKIGLKVGDYPIILAMAKRANALRYGKDPLVLDTLAAEYARSGDMPKALATQKVAASRLTPKSTTEERKTVLDHLASNKAGKVPVISLQ